MDYLFNNVLSIVKHKMVGCFVDEELKREAVVA
jgi:hypothetical protein